ncbi:1-acyl-sn-glycerol-3-phosphate acyltransferase [bacterium]|nr:1-acyl-sn-glycerol-3-phosphate acyltransferase [bacterium]
MIEFIRGVAILISVFVFGIGALIISYILIPLVKLFEKDEKKRHIYFSFFVQKSWQIFVRFVTVIRVLKVNEHDFEKLKSIKNSIIVATHPTYLDVVILLSIIPKTTCFVAPRIVKNFFMGNIVKSVFLTSSDTVEEFEKQAKEMYNEGFNILIFPSGKRHELNAKPKLKKGAALLAKELRCDIVPIKIVTDFEFLKRNVPIYKGGVKVAIYDINVFENIKTLEYLEKFKDDIVFKKELTSKISDVLFET